MSALLTRGLSKAYAGRVLFEDLSLEVARGEALGLMGPSGTGKTTLLRCLNGLELADRGEVRVGDACIRAGDPPKTRLSAIAAVRRRVGFVFQGNHLFSHRTVLENVMEGPLYVRREDPARAEARARALLDKVGIAERARCRAASSSAPPSRAPWRWSRRSCCSTNRPARSTTSVR